MNQNLLYQFKKDTFLRDFGAIAYLTNQTSGKDRVYDSVGGIFLNLLGRQPRRFSELLHQLNDFYPQTAQAELKEQLKSFLQELEQEGFIISGRDGAELNLQDIGFTYHAPNPKTIRSFVAEDLRHDLTGSGEFMEQYCRDHPQVFSVHLEICNSCNQRCVHCYQPDHDKGFMPMAMLESIFDQLEDLKTLSVTISGGEPLLHPQFDRIISLARAKDLMINLLTNGTLVNDRMAKMLRDKNIAMAQVSIFSMDALIHDQITRSPGSLAKALRGIELLIENEVPVQVNCPILTVNSRSYREIAHWCHARKIRVLNDFVLMARSDQDTSNLKYRISAEQAEGLIRDILSVDIDYKQLLKIDPELREKYRQPDQAVCGIGVSSICIAFDGTVYPCAGFHGLVLGQLHSDTLKNIWTHSPQIIELRKLKQANFPQCLSCAARDYCIMCLVRNFNENQGDIFTLNQHYCDVAFLNKKLVEEGFAHGQEGRISAEIC